MYLREKCRFFAKSNQTNIKYYCVNLFIYYCGKNFPSPEFMCFCEMWALKKNNKLYF